MPYELWCNKSLPSKAVRIYKTCVPGNASLTLKCSTAPIEILQTNCVSTTKTDNMKEMATYVTRNYNRTVRQIQNKTLC